MQLIKAIVGLLLANVCSGAAPTVSVVSNTLLDPKGIFFVSFDGVVNVNSFQLSAVLAFQSFQYAAWYTSTGMAILGRRTLPSGAWSTLQLPHNISTSDSHNVISLGVSPQDGKIHVALDCHSTQVLRCLFSEMAFINHSVAGVLYQFRSKLGNQRGQLGGQPICTDNHNARNSEYRNVGPFSRLSAAADISREITYPQ